MTLHSTQQIFEQYHARLLRFISKRVGNLDDAEDILQDAFLKIHTRINTLEDNTKLNGWIYSITRNTIIDYYRRKKQLKELPNSLTAPEAESSESARRELAECFSPLVESLPPLVKNSVRLAEIDGLSHKEVARKQGLSLSAAKSRILRGRSMLKVNLLKCCHFEFDAQGRVLDFANKQPICKDCC